MPLLRFHQGLVTRAIANFSEVFRGLQPYRQKELMRPVLHKATLGPECLKLGLYGRPPEVGPLSGSESRFQTLKWLPGQMSESAVLWDMATLLACGSRLRWQHTLSIIRT